MEEAGKTGLGRYLTCLPLFWMYGDFPEELQELLEEEWKQRTAGEVPFEKCRPEKVPKADTDGITRENRKEAVTQRLEGAISRLAKWKEETGYNLEKFQIAFLFFAQPEETEQIKEQISVIKEVFSFYRYDLQLYAFYDFTQPEEQKKKACELLEELRREASVAVFTQELLKVGKKEAYRKAVHAVGMNCFLNCVEERAGRVTDAIGNESSVKEKGTLYTAGCHTLDIRKLEKEQIRNTDETESAEQYKKRVRKAVEDTVCLFCEEKRNGFEAAPVCWQAVEAVLPKGLLKSGENLQCSDLLEYLYGTSRPLTDFLTENMPSIQEVLPAFWEQEKGSLFQRKHYLEECLKTLLEETKKEKQQLETGTTGQTVWIKKGIQPKELSALLAGCFSQEKQQYLLERREELLEKLLELLEKKAFESPEDSAEERQEMLLLEKVQERMQDREKAASVLYAFGESLGREKAEAETTKYYGAKLNAVFLTEKDAKAEVFYIKPWEKMPLTVEDLGGGMKNYLPKCRVESREWQKAYCVELFVLRKLTDMSAVGADKT